jgi:hypothetical protein
MTNPTDLSIPLTGGCQCGAVRYTARVTSRDAYCCHCSMCRRAFGNIFAALFNLPKEDVTWTAREPTYYASSRIARRGFCAACGTPLTFEYNESKRMDLSVGSLDHPEELRLTSHCGVESRVPGWTHDDGLPTQRIDEIEHIVKKWRAAYGDDVVPGTRVS